MQRVDNDRTVGVSRPRRCCTDTYRRNGHCVAARPDRRAIVLRAPPLAPGPTRHPRAPARPSTHSRCTARPRSARSRLLHTLVAPARGTWCRWWARPTDGHAASPDRSGRARTRTPRQARLPQPRSRASARRRAVRTRRLRRLTGARGHSCGRSRRRSGQRATTVRPASGSASVTDASTSG